VHESRNWSPFRRPETKVGLPQSMGKQSAHACALPATTAGSVEPSELGLGCLPISY
jgi:hypothetical protein